MTPSADSRQRILDRIRIATRPVAAAPARLATVYSALPRPYIRQGSRTPEARIELLVERLREYDAEVVECTPGQLVPSIAAKLAASDKHTFVVPSGLLAEWLVPGFDFQIDRGLNNAEIDKVDGVVTAAFCAVADSGTIVLHHDLAEGRRVISLLPDWHLCILRASQVVETLPEYFDRCAQPPQLATWISGPSATADIEMTRIKGVHGPRFLHVILVRDEN